MPKHPRKHYLPPLFLSPSQQESNSKVRCSELAWSFLVLPLAFNELSSQLKYIGVYFVLSYGDTSRVLGGVVRNRARYQSVLSCSCELDSFNPRTLLDSIRKSISTQYLSLIIPFGVVCVACSYLKYGARAQQLESYVLTTVRHRSTPARSQFLVRYTIDCLFGLLRAWQLVVARTCSFIEIRIWLDLRRGTD